MMFQLQVKVEIAHLQTCKRSQFPIVAKLSANLSQLVLFFHERFSSCKMVMKRVVGKLEKQVRRSSNFKQIENQL